MLILAILLAGMSIAVGRTADLVSGVVETHRARSLPEQPVEAGLRTELGHALGVAVAPSDRTEAPLIRIALIVPLTGLGRLTRPVTLSIDRRPWVGPGPLALRAIGAARAKARIGVSARARVVRGDLATHRQGGGVHAGSSSVCRLRCTTRQDEHERDRDPRQRDRRVARWPSTRGDLPGPDATDPSLLPYECL